MSGLSVATSPRRRRVVWTTYSIFKQTANKQMYRQYVNASVHICRFRHISCRRDYSASSSARLQCGTAYMFLRLHTSLECKNVAAICFDTSVVRTSFCRSEVRIYPSTMTGLHFLPYCCWGMGLHVKILTLKLFSEIHILFSSLVVG
jgi:hypothetical protein